jgi:hypothetical protein
MYPNLSNKGLAILRNMAMSHCGETKMVEKPPENISFKKL